MTDSKAKLKKSVPKPKRSGDVTRKGKTPVSWDNDPEILHRLALVAMLMNQNKPAYIIAEKTKTAIATAKRDIARVRELWREDAKARLTNTTDVAIAQYASIIEKAWDDMNALSPGTPAVASYMNIILRAQERMDKVTGIADPIALEGKAGGPIELSIVEMEKVRENRWKSVSSQLAAAVAAKQKDNDGSKDKDTA